MTVLLQSERIMTWPEMENSRVVGVLAWADRFCERLAEVSTRGVRL